MATQCLITSGWGCPDCTDKFGVPGIERDEIWIGNKSEVTAFISTISGEISDITFDFSYNGFRKICLHKNTGSFTEELVVGENSASHYTQNFVGRVIDDSTAVRNAIEDLVDVDTVIVFKKKNGKFQVVGETGGVALSENEKTSGATTGDDFGDLLTFTGTNNGKARYFFDTDAATTQATLDGLVV